MSDQASLGTDTVIIGPVWDMWAHHQARGHPGQGRGVPAAQNFGSFSFMGKGESYFAPYHKWEAKVPADLRATVEKLKQEILDGTHRVDVDESTPHPD